MRSALPHSRVMVHHPLVGVQGQASDILIEAKEIEKLRTELFSIIAEHSGQPDAKVTADGERNFWMTYPGSPRVRDGGLAFDDEVLSIKERVVNLIRVIFSVLTKTALGYYLSTKP